LAEGRASGIIFHTFLVMVGIAELIQNSTFAFNVLKIFCAIYLIFLVTKSFQSALASMKESKLKFLKQIYFKVEF